MVTQIKIGWLLLIIFILAGCGSEIEVAPPTATATVAVAQPTATAAVQHGRATVEAIEVSVEEIEIVALIRGQLADGCTQIDEIGKQQSGQMLTATITTVRLADQLCTQALTPFEELVRFERSGLTPGLYTLQANEAAEQFYILDLDSTALEVESNQVAAGAAPSLRGIGFPPGSTVAVGIGRPDSEYAIIDSVEADRTGSFTLRAAVPASAEAGSDIVFVAVVDGQEVVSAPVLIASSTGGTVESANLFLIALEDGGQSGQTVGCGDSLVAVEISFAPTQAPLTAALEALLAIEEQFYGESGLYNALYQSDLAIASVAVENGHARIDLTGNLVLGGTCDAPRVQAQLQQVALQFATVESVAITIDGVPLDSLLSERG